MTQRFHGAAWSDSLSRLAAPEPVRTFLQRIYAASLVPVVAITIVDDCPTSPTFNHYGAFKRADKTHDTHVDVASVPTSTSLTSTFDLIIRQALATDATKFELDGDCLTYLPDLWMGSDHPDLRNMAAASVINALFARKLGLAGALASGELVYSFGPFSLTIAEINHPLGPDGTFDNERVETPSGYGREHIAMGHLRVGSVKNFKKWPTRTAFYSDIQFGEEADFIAMIDERVAQRLFPNGGLSCSFGSCVRTARSLITRIERSGGRKPVLHSSTVVVGSTPAHEALCREVGTSLRSLIEGGARDGPVPYARVDATSTVRYDLGNLRDGRRRTLVVCPVELANPDAMQFDESQTVTVLTGTVTCQTWQPAPADVNLARTLNEIAGNEISPLFAFDVNNRLRSNDPVLFGLSWSSDRSPIDAMRHVQAGNTATIEKGQVVQLIPRFVPTAPFVAYLCEGPALPEGIYADDPVARARNGSHSYGRPAHAREVAAQVGKFLALLATQYPDIDSTLVLPVAPVTLR